MNKKTIFIFLSILTSLFVGVYIVSCNPDAKAPERLSDIPEEAEWVGGVDGGIWYQISKVISKNTFKIKIYNDRTGELEIDTTFILNPECVFKEIDSSKLVKSINGFDGKSIGLLLPENDKRCSLIFK